MSRYLLIEVGCLECSFDADSEPKEIGAFDTEDEALAALRATDYAHLTSVDAFVLDTRDRWMLTAGELAKRERSDAERG